MSRPRPTINLEEKARIKLAYETVSNAENLAFLTGTPAGETVIKKRRIRISQAVSNLIRLKKESISNIGPFLSEIATIEAEMNLIREIQSAPDTLQAAQKILDESLGGE